MKHLLKYTIPAVIVGFIVTASVAAQVAPPQFFKKIGNNVYPLNPASTTIGTSTAVGQFGTLTDAGGTKYVTSTSGGSGGASTSSPNTFAATNTFPGGIVDAIGAHVASVYTYYVSPVVGQGDFTKVEDALAAASTTQKATTIFIASGTYTAPAGGWKVCSSNLDIIGVGVGLSSLQFNPTNASSGISMCDGTQRTVDISHITLKASNSALANGTACLDFDHFVKSHFYDMLFSACATNAYASSTGTLYNTFQQITWNPTGTLGFANTPTSTGGNYGLYLGNVVNDNVVLPMSRCQSNTSTTCYYLKGHANSLYSPDAETNALYGIYVDNGAHDTSIYSPYLEDNQTNMFFATGTYNVNIFGGFNVDSNLGSVDIAGNTSGVNFYGMTLDYAPYTSLASTTFTGNVTTTNLTIGNVTSSILKTSGAGVVSPAVSGGTDYVRSLTLTTTTLTYSKQLDATTTVFTDSNSAAATTSYTLSVPGNTLGTSGATMRIHAFGSFFNNSTSTASLTLTLTYGGSNAVVLSSSAVASSSNVGNWDAECNFSNASGTTNTQIGGCTLAIKGGGTATGNFASGAAIAVDSTQTQSLLFKLTNSLASSTIVSALTSIQVMLDGATTTVVTGVSAN